MIDRPIERKATIRWQCSDGLDALTHTLSAAVIAVIEEAIAMRGSATIALAGGATPVPIFRHIASHDLDWSRVTVLPTDDRLVGEGDPLSNAAMLGGIFGPNGAKVVALAEAGATIEHAAEDANRIVEALSFPLDLVWTGVGADGHTASILAGPDIETAFGEAKSRRIVGVRPDPLPPEAPVPRVTMTCATLLDTRTLFVVATGADKRARIEQGLSEGAAGHLPIGRVLAAANRPVDIFWCP